MDTYDPAAKAWVISGYQCLLVVKKACLELP
jgi:hypothetical protein